MKYFTAQLWRDINSDKIKVASRAWDLNFEKYHKQLKALKPHLSSKNFSFFTKFSLHDGYLTSVRLSRSGEEAKKLHLSASNRFPIWQVEIEAIEPERERKVKLLYEKVRSFFTDYPEKAPLFDDYGDIGDWGYDELTRTKNGFFQHEILFSTGATIRIVFEKFSHSISKP